MSDKFNIKKHDRKDVISCYKLFLNVIYNINLIKDRFLVL